MLLQTMDIDYISSLNDDCLTEIFGKFDLMDLIRASLINHRFLNIVIGSKLVDLSEINKQFSIRTALCMFGDNIRKLKFSEDDLQYNLEMVTNTEKVFLLMEQFCSAEKLSELQLDVF